MSLSCLILYSKKNLNQSLELASSNSNWKLQLPRTGCKLLNSNCQSNTNVVVEVCKVAIKRTSRLTVIDSWISEVTLHVGHLEVVHMCQQQLLITPQLSSLNKTLINRTWIWHLYFSFSWLVYHPSFHQPNHPLMILCDAYDWLTYQSNP